MYTLISPGDHLRITCNQTDWTRSINNVINIPRTIMHPAPPPTPPRPVAEHDTTWSSAAEHQQRDQHSTKDNTPHPTPPPTPPCPVAEHDTTGSSAAGQQPVCGHRRTWVPEGIYIYIYIYIYIANLGPKLRQVYHRDTSWIMMINRWMEWSNLWKKILHFEWSPPWHI